MMTPNDSDYLELTGADDERRAALAFVTEAFAGAVLSGLRAKVSPMRRCSPPCRNWSTPMAKTQWRLRLPPAGANQRRRVHHSLEALTPIGRGRLNRLLKKSVDRPRPSTIRQAQRRYRASSSLSE